jgi:tetratricopeptide (TPR) repeat protein
LIRSSVPGINSWRALALWAVSLASIASLIGCASAQEKSARHFADAEHWAAEGKINEAIVEYRRAIQLNPKDPKAHLALAKIFIDRQDIPSGVQQLKIVLKNNPDDHDANVALAKLLIKTPQFAQAKALSDSLLKKNPNDTDALLISAQCALKTPDLPAANLAIDRVLQLDPENGQAWFLRAMSQLAEKKTSESEASLLRSIVYDPKSVPPVTFLSALMTRRGDLSGAEQVIRKALVQNPQSIQVHYLLALFLLSQDRGKEAEDLFQQISTLGDDNPTYRGALARYYVMMGNTQGAEKAYQNILKQHPDDVQNSLQLAQVYIEESKTSDAEQLVNAVMKKSPNDPGSLLFRGRLLVEKGDLDGGIGDMERAAQVKPDWYLPQYYLGLGYIRKDKLNLAEAALNKSISLEPTFQPARLVLARLDIEQGRPEQAITTIQKTVDQKPQNIDPYLVRSLALVQEGHYDEAEKDTLPLIDEFPQPPARAMTYRTLAEAKFRQGRFEEAHTFAKQSLVYDTTSREGLTLLGTSQVALKKNNEAVTEVQSYVNSNPKWAPGYEVLAQLQSLVGRPSDAEISLRKALELDPKSISAQLTLSDIELNQGKLDSAMDLLSKVSETGSQMAIVQIRMGQIAEMKQDWKAAEDYYSKALKISPTDVVAKNNLAWVYAEHGGNIDTALKLAQEASKEKPDSADISDTLAWILIKKKNYGTAIQLLKDCVQKEPNNAEFNFHLGKAYIEDGRMPEGKQSLLTASKSGSDSSYARQAKELLATLPRS